MRRLLLLTVLAACHHTEPSTTVGNGTASDAPSCDADGAPIFVQRRWAIHANPPPNEPPGQTIIIREGGAWSVGGEDAASGCLTADELASLRAHLGAAALEPPGGMHCDAMPIQHYDATFGGQMIAWDSPCGQSPDTASQATIGCAWDLTTQRASPQGACR